MEILQYYNEDAKKIVFCAFALGSKNEIKKFYELTGHIPQLCDNSDPNYKN